MKETEIFIVGAGPGGLTAGILLAQAGRSVIVADPRVPFEKPCGGGLTPRILDYLPIDPRSLPSTRAVRQVRIEWSGADSVDVELPRPLLITSRRELGAALLNRFRAAGGGFIQGKVTDVRAWKKGWTVKLEPNWSVRCRFILYADGVYGYSRRRLGHFRDPRNWTRAMGARVSGEWSRVMIRFEPGMNGYGWVFPRSQGASVGVCDDLRSRGPYPLKHWLEAWLRTMGIEVSEFYGYLIPSLWQLKDAFPVFGPNWVRLGDASGYVDPITREGIYYAVRMGVHVAQALIDHGYPEQVHGWFHEEVLPEWRWMVRWRRIFFRPIFQQMYRRALKSARVRELTGRLMVGEVSYRHLTGQLLGSLVRFSGSASSGN